MKNKSFSSIVIGIAILASGTLAAQNDRYDAVYEKLTKEYTLNPDGSMDYRYIKEQKLQTYRAFHNLYGESFIVYDTSRQQLKINEVFTVMADGRKVAAPENAFNLVLPGYAANAPAYNFLREMVITHTGLERNAVIHLDYLLKSGKGVLPFLAGYEILAENEPVKNLEIRVRVPMGTKLHHKVFNLSLQPEQMVENNYQVFVWKLTDVAAISAEEGQSGGLSQYPRLVFSTLDKPSEAYDFFTRQPAFNYTVSDEMKAAAAGLSNKYRDKFELALKIQEMVVDELRLYPVPFRTAMYSVRTPEQVWASNGGTVAEKAVLLASLMRSAGFDAKVAAVVRTSFSDGKIATLSDMEDFVVNIDFADEGPWYFSVTALNSVNLSKTLSGRSFVIFGPDGKATHRKTDLPSQMIRVIGNFVVSSDPKLNGEVSLYFEGAAYPKAGLSRDKKRMRNSLSGNMIKADTNNLKKNILNNENGFQSYIVQSDKPMKKDSGFLFFNIPAVTSGIENWNIRTLSEKRESAYEIPSVADESYAYTITLPSNLVLFTPAMKQTISNKAGTFTLEINSEYGKVTVKRSLKFSETFIPVAVYPEFKLLMDSWNNPWNKVVVFRQQ